MANSRTRAAWTAALLVALDAGTGLAAEPRATCADCHGKDGASAESDVPIVGGLSEPYLVDAMAAYRSRSRPCPETRYRGGDRRRPATDMCRIAAELGVAGAAAVARQLAAAPFVPARQQTDPARVAAGRRLHELHCEKCHADGGRSNEDDAGVLAGQWMPYLRASMDEFVTGKRPTPDKMKPKIEKLTAADIDALIHFYGSQQ